jgi:GNAT superfamily N-acetyltransferase
MATPQRLEIRAATPADHASFVRLVNMLVPDEPTVLGPRFEREFMPTTLIAESAGSCVGYTYFRVHPDRGHLGHLVIAPEARRTGIGRALVAEVIARLRAAGSTQITLNCRPENAAARALYESFGLKPIRTNRALKLRWSLVPTEGPVARAIDPTQDAALEAEFALPVGTFAMFRAKADRIFLACEDGMTIYDTAYGGSATFKARSLEVAWTLLRGIRAAAPPTAEQVLLSLDDDQTLTSALQGAGATLRLETLFMTAPI